jgi:hypothetical protein
MAGAFSPVLSLHRAGVLLFTVLPRRGLLGNLASGIELRFRTLLTKNVTVIELTQA